MGIRQTVPQIPQMPPKLTRQPQVYYVAQPRLFIAQLYNQQQQRHNTQVKPQHKRVTQLQQGSPPVQHAYLPRQGHQLSRQR